MKNMFAVALLLAGLPFVAMAEDVATPSAAVEAVPPPPCKKPLIGANKLRKADDNSDEADKVQKYQDCIMQYGKDQQAISQAHQKAANDAINSFNAFVKEYNDSKGQ